jgi:putative tryptophan/tyrosine transport system substrate-binding protein
MRVLFLLTLLTFFLQAQTVLVINSNSNVKKYNDAVEEFGKNFHSPFKTLDISDKNTQEIKNSLYDEYPDIVYAIGAKAYQYANHYIPEKEIYFSSIVDWKRMGINDHHYGVSNELYSGMQLTLIKTIFSDVKTIGIVYSQHTQNMVHDLTQNGSELGIRINSIKIDKESVPSIAFDDFIGENDAILIIPDPLFIQNEKGVETLFASAKRGKKPIIAYHELFLHYGATLVISADNPTIGRQIAAMIDEGNTPDRGENVQFPAGTHIIFNKIEGEKIGIPISPDILSIATEIIE